MPDWVKDDEIWKRAKKAVNSDNPDLKKGSDKYWATVTEVYKKMGGKVA